MKSRNLAVIPARSGSKGLPDKNIREINGKPLIAYTIEAAFKSEVFDEVMVSTDSEKYSKIAIECGASVPFLRSEKNSSDTSKTNDTIFEILNCYKELGKEFDTVCILQPTSPLRNDNDIIEAYKVYNDKKALFVVAVTEIKHTPAWTNTLGDNFSLDGFMERDTSPLRQEVKSFYRVNGAIYFMNVKAFLEDSFYYRKGAYAYIMPSERSIDIDDEEDLLYLEFYLNRIQGF